jgi:hypothetical protein
MPKNHDNSNVSNILPLTTFRNIDLGGNRNRGRLFSRFYEETKIFFEADAAPEAAASQQSLRSLAASRDALLRVESAPHPLPARQAALAAAA